MDGIVVGVDGSQNSRTALRWAGATATAIGAPLRVVGAWQYPADTTLTIGGIDLRRPAEADRLVEEDLQRLVVEELGTDDAEKIDIEVRRGPAAGVLLELAADHPTMIVVGSRGLGGFRGLLLGSVSRQLSEHARVPLTVVRGATPTDPPVLRRLVVGTDGSDHAARALAFAGEIARRASTELVVANVVVDPFEVGPPPGIDAPLTFEAPTPSEVTRDAAERRALVEQWCAPLRQEAVRYRVVLAHGDARTALPDVARREGADLLIVGSRGLGRTRRLLLGSVATSLVQHGEVPVTIVRQP